MITVYIKAEQSTCFTHPKIQIQDVAKVYCYDKDVETAVRKTQVYEFSSKENGKEVFSIMKLIELIQKEHKDVSVENMGVTDFIVYYKPDSKPNHVLIGAKIAFVCLVSFFGSAFSIMTYNNDVSANEVFQMLEKLITGRASSGPSIVQLMYSIGLSIGVIVFFNHAANKKLSDDPTPFEVQMRLYERDVNDTFIVGADRKEESIDVD